MIIFTKEAKDFLEKYLPLSLNKEAVNDVLSDVSKLIEKEGFEPPLYYDYNKFGVYAQKIYDDIYNNAIEEAPQ